MTPVPPYATSKMPDRTMTPPVAVAGVSPVEPPENELTPPAAPFVAELINPCESTVMVALV